MNELQKLQNKLADQLNASIKAINEELEQLGMKDKDYVVVSRDFGWQIVLDENGCGYVEAPLCVDDEALRMSKDGADWFITQDLDRDWVVMETRDYLARLLADNERKLKKILSIK